jgi:hypothetical protein
MELASVMLLIQRGEIVSHEAAMPMTIVLRVLLSLIGIAEMIGAYARHVRRKWRHCPRFAATQRGCERLARLPKHRSIVGKSHIVREQPSEG